VLSTTPDAAYYVLDLPLKEQSQHAKRAVANFVKHESKPAERAKVQRILESQNLSASDRVAGLEAFARSAGLSPKALSLRLRQHGLAGYKYLDRASRKQQIDKDSKFN